MQKPRFISEFELMARRKRFSLFASLLSNTDCHSSDAPTKILDIGGTWGYWSKVNYSVLRDVEIILLNVFLQKEVQPPFKSVVGDGRNLTIYGDREFDIVHSNSVLGHVGTFQDQKSMAQEIRRIGKRYFVQTPNHRFIVDWRTLVPFFHFVPVSCQAWCFRSFSVGTYPRIRDFSRSIHQASRVRNLTLRELKMLFPDATIVHERVLGLTKSFIVHSGFSTCRNGSLSKLC